MALLYIGNLYCCTQLYRYMYLLVLRLKVLQVVTKYKNSP